MSEDVFSRLEKKGSNQSEEVDVLEQVDKEERQKRKKALIAAGIVAALGIGTVSFFVFDGDDAIKGAFTKNDEKKTAGVYGSTTTVKGGSTGKSGSTLSTSDTGIAAKIPDWSMQEYDTVEDKSGLSEKILDEYDNTGLNEYTTEMESELAGYHSRGEMDDMQVPYTREDYIRASGEYIERLINPTFGGWSDMQYSNADINNNFPTGKLLDMFSTRYAEANKGAPLKTWMPVYADWEGNDYGMDNLSNVSRWHGEVDNIKTQVNNYGSVNENIKVAVDVTFYAWDNDGQKIKQQGQLFLTLIPGKESKGERVIVIDQADLRIN